MPEKLDVNPVYKGVIVSTQRAERNPCGVFFQGGSEMREARRRELDEMLRGLAPRHQRQLSISTSNALDMFSVIEVRMFGCISARLVSHVRARVRIRLQGRENDIIQTGYRSLFIFLLTECYYLTYYCSASTSVLRLCNSCTVHSSVEQQNLANDR